MSESSSHERRPAIFLDGWSIAEQAVFVEADASEARIYGVDAQPGGEPMRRWSANGLRCDAMQEGGVLHVTHDAVPQETLVVRDSVLERRLLGLSTHVQALPGGSRQLRFGLACLAVLAVLAGAFHHFTPAISHAIAVRVPVEQERSLGAELETALHFVGCQNRDSNAVLHRLATKLAAERAIEFQIIHAEFPNAFALPGGRIVMTDQLVQEAAGPDEIAGVLAHEIEHVAQRHVLASVVRDTMLSAIWAITMGDYAGLLVVDPRTAYHIVNLQFSREDETVADAGALRRLHAAGISHRGLIAFFERHEKQNGEGGPAWLSTHPSTDERLALLRAAKDVAHPVAALSAEELATLRSACKNVVQHAPDAAPEPAQTPTPAKIAH